MANGLLLIHAKFPAVLIAAAMIFGGDARGQTGGAAPRDAEINDLSGDALRLGAHFRKAGLGGGIKSPAAFPRSPGVMPMGVVRRVPQQYPTIQAGINASANGDTVLVSEGTYFENIKYRGKRIVVASLYLQDRDTAHVSRTIIDGSRPLSPDSGSVVSFVAGEDTNSVLCGFTVRGGYGTYIPAWDEGDGGGVFLWQSGGRLVRNIITGNHVEAPNAWGGGVSMTGSTNTGQTLIMEDNIVTRNTVTAATGYGFGGGVSIFRSRFRLAGNIFERDSARGMVQAGASGAFVFFASGNLGVIQGNIFRHNVVFGDSSAYATLCIAQYEGEVAIDGNVIEDNTVESVARLAYGGAVYVDDVIPGSPEKRITRNVIRRNRLISGTQHAYGGAMLLWNARVRVAANIIQNNTSQAGGIAYGGGIFGIRWAGTIENNLITGNRGTNGGGMGHTGAVESGVTQAVINNTFSGNTANSGGGLWGSSTSTSVLVNNIFWHDSSATGEISSSGTVEAHYSNIEGGWSGGTGNINANPLFADTLYRLGNASASIGAGADSILIAGTWYRAPSGDVSANSRPMPADSRPDMGASENSRGTPTAIGDADQRLPAVFALAQNYPNPFNPTTTIRFDIPAGAVGHVTLGVYDVLGREIATLADEIAKPGSYEVTWDAAGVASGIYFYRLRVTSGAGGVGGLVATKKLILMR